VGEKLTLQNGTAIVDATDEAGKQRRACVDGLGRRVRHKGFRCESRTK
jgi:hypothetical protein